MTDQPRSTADADAITRKVSAFYEQHPYPPPVKDLDHYQARWNDARRRADSHLFWPGEAYREDRSILVAGCGTSQAAKYALRWPQAQVLGIDFSANSIEQTERLKRKYKIANLELRQLPLERATELGRSFEYVVSTGVLHHLPDPDQGLRALRDVLAPAGALHLMVYAPYGRAGVYLLQDYCARLGIGTSAQEIQDLAASMQALPPDHPLVPLLRNAPDFRDPAGLADALLHPQDRSYSVPQLLNFLDATGFSFGRWLRQAAYLPQCGMLATSPHQALLARLPPQEQYAAVELFRGSMLRHSAVAYRKDSPQSGSLAFEGDAWLGFVPIRLPDTLVVLERLPPGAAAVLINPRHSYTDLYLPITAPQKALFEAIDGRRTIGEIVPQTEQHAGARRLFQGLWDYDQTVFDTSARRP